MNQGDWGADSGLQSRRITPHISCALRQTSVHNERETDIIQFIMINNLYNLNEGNKYVFVKFDKQGNNT